MKILVVTGKLAEATAKEASKGLADVLTMDVDVAAFVTPGMLRRKKERLLSYDLILVSGQISADFSRLEKEVGVPIRLGPKHAFDLSFVLPLAEKIDFSNKIPACEILASKIKKEALSRFSKLEKDAKPSFLLKELKIGGNSSMKVMGEIVDSTLLSDRGLAKKIEDYVSMGADIIDLGVGLDCGKADVRGVLKKAISISEVPVSIDTSNTKFMLIGVECGCDLVLSLDSRSLKEVGKEIANHDLSAVIVPDCLDNPNSKIIEGMNSLKSLKDNIKIGRDMGIEKIIADPVLSPIGHGSLKSLVNYYHFREYDKITPLFFGIGNVTELIDADSIGVNATLAGLAMELNSSILFTPEYSNKARGSISELKKASQMMFLAKERNSAPKDIGIDLLVIKEKRRRMEVMQATRDNLSIVHAQPKKMWSKDPCGSFKIYIDDSKICARHKDLVILGKDAKEVFDTIVENDLVSSLEHAGYLGRELMRAQLALQFKRSYVQDDEF